MKTSGQTVHKPYCEFPAVVLPGRPPAIVAPIAAQFLGCKTRDVTRAIGRNQNDMDGDFFEASNRESEYLKSTGWTSKRSSRSLPVMLTFRGMIKLLRFIRTPPATKAYEQLAGLIERAVFPGRLNITNCDLQPTPGAELQHVTSLALPAPETKRIRSRKPTKPRLTCPAEPVQVDAVQAFADQHRTTKARALQVLIETGLEHIDEAAAKLR